MKFILDNIWLVLVALVSGGALLWPYLGRGKNVMPMAQAVRLVGLDETTVLDVRPAADYAAGHVRGSKNIPLAELGARIGELDQAKSVLVVCQAGVSSLRGVSQLRRAGFADVHSLDGGFNAWQASGLPVAKSK